MLTADEGRQPERVREERPWERRARLFKLWNTTASRLRNEGRRPERIPEEDRQDGGWERILEHRNLGEEYPGETHVLINGRFYNLVERPLPNYSDSVTTIRDQNDRLISYEGLWPEEYPDEVEHIGFFEVRWHKEEASMLLTFEEENGDQPESD